MRLTDRRTFLALGTGAFLVATIPFARSRRRLVRRSLPVMGTLAELAVVHRNERAAHRAIDAAFAELKFVDRTMSRFRPTSDIGRINAATGPVRVGEPTAVVLAAALRWAHGTDGSFDPCARQGQAGRRQYRALELDRGFASRHEPDLAVDLGGIAKGYGVDRAVAALRAHGIEHGFVNAGGDLFAMGESENGDAWRVGVRSPHDPAGIVATLEVRDRAVATSGDYLRPHLIDPRTGLPYRAGRHSLTVTAPTCLSADAAATALFGSGSEALLRRMDPDAALVA